MRSVITLLFLLFVFDANAITYQLGFNGTPLAGFTNCNNLPESYRVTASCADALLAANACLTANGVSSSYKASSCSAATIVAGTKIFVNPSQTAYITAIAPVTKCPAGQYYNYSLGMCASEIAQTLSSCMPSIRTVSPCPSGYAPTTALPIGSGAATPLSSDFDRLPIQDMIYAVGVAVCALLGVSVGVRLL